MCAPNGARKTRDDHRALPISPEELADCAESVRDAGASILHLHVRNSQGAHSLDVGLYRKAIEAVEKRVGRSLVIQVTTEACGVYSPQQQMDLVRELRPEAASIALKEICPDDSHEDIAGKFMAEVHAAGTMVQHILYSPEDVLKFRRLQSAGVIPEPKPFVLFVLGRYSAKLRGDVADIDAFVAALDGVAEWSVCCFGEPEAAAAAAAADNDGHARVGFENNLWLPDGRLAEDNAELVTLAASNRGDRPLAGADDVRKLFGR